MKLLLLLKHPGPPLEMIPRSGRDGRRGYTVKTQLNPYDENRVAISDNYFSKSNIELDNTVVTMVPTRVVQW